VRLKLYLYAVILSADSDLYFKVTPIALVNGDLSSTKLAVKEKPAVCGYKVELGISANQ